MRKLINHNLGVNQYAAKRQAIALKWLRPVADIPMVRSMTETDKSENAPQKGERIAKVLARAGVASRREVERMIADGRIAISGKILETPATLVTSLKGIMVDGQPVAEVSQTKLWRFHKRRGTLTTSRDPEGRETVFDKLPAHMGRVISVGRLDMNTEGLLLFTNDGELARWLELPANSVLRKYRVRVYGRVEEKALAGLKDGVTIDGVHYGAIDASLERQQGSNAWLTIAIREGKNREVRKVMEHLGLAVNRLIRTNYGPFSLGTLEVSSIAQVGEKQLYEVLSDYFGDAPQVVGTDTIKRDPSKWAKAKKDTNNKPGAKRRRQFKAGHGQDERKDTGATKDGRKRLSVKPDAKSSDKKSAPSFERGKAKPGSTRRHASDSTPKGRPPKGQERALSGSKGKPNRGKK